MASFTANQINYRPMLVEDLAAVVAIEQESHQSPWRRQQFLSSLESSHQAWLMEMSTRPPAILAYAVTSTAADEAELLNITVAPAFRRQGFAMALLNTLCTSFAGEITTLFLELRVSNHAAMTLYQRCGFNEVGYRPNYYPAPQGREDAVIMAKYLG